MCSVATGLQMKQWVECSHISGVEAGFFLESPLEVYLNSITTVNSKSRSSCTLEEPNITQTGRYLYRSLLSHLSEHIYNKIIYI